MSDHNIERKARAGLPRSHSEERRFVRTYAMGRCPRCYADGDEPCVSMVTGKRTGTHRGRLVSSTVPRFVGKGNKLSEAGFISEARQESLCGFRDPHDLISYDPPDATVLPEGGAYVTFTQGGGPTPSDGGYRFLRAGHTYFARWAPGTVEGYNEHGQYQVMVETPHGPAWLFPYEYVVLAPLHLWSQATIPPAEHGYPRFRGACLLSSDAGVAAP